MPRHRIGLDFRRQQALHLLERRREIHREAPVRVRRDVRRLRPDAPQSLLELARALLPFLLGTSGGRGRNVRRFCERFRRHRREVSFLVS
jgi:hypothetical protein